MNISCVWSGTGTKWTEEEMHAAQHGPDEHCQTGAREEGCDTPLREERLALVIFSFASCFQLHDNDT